MLDILLAPIRQLKPREWLIVLAGILIGLMVSFMFKSMMLGQKPPQSERINGPLNTVESPRMFSLALRKTYHDALLDVRADAIRISGGQTMIEMDFSFHPGTGGKTMEIGSYEPPNFVEPDGRMVLGTFNPPESHHFRTGENYRTLISFPESPRHLPISVTLFLGERLDGRFHMQPVVLTGLSPAPEPHR
ncbi:MAG: hypothetical protein M1297_05540 [Nitrospirae bacterium]|jgi:hypothetical protein|nr:hypothetical protein [Nitrospirota bacterium]